MAVPKSENLHATSVAIDGRVVLIEGASGTGKSDLALRLIDRGATLVSDDRTLVVRQGATLIARAPDTIRGQIEVRGLGILTLPQVDDLPIALIVTLGIEPERMPERRQRQLGGVGVMALAFEAYHVSTPLKIEWALRQPDATPA